MFGDVGQARTNAAMLLLMIDTTSSRTCTKPTVSCSAFMSQSLYRINKIVKVIIEITKTLNPCLNLMKFSFVSKTLNVDVLQ